MRKYFMNGSISHKIYTVISESKKPLTSRQIAELIDNDPKRTIDILNNLRQRGLVKSTPIKNPIGCARHHYTAMPYETSQDRYTSAIGKCGGKASATQVGVCLGLSERTTRNYLLRLCERGVINSHKEGERRLFTLKDYGAKALFNVWR